MSPVFRHGRLRLYLLKLLDESPRHGYEVIRLLQDRFMGVYAPSPGTIYPRLARLEEDGLVTHEEVDGKKVYSITDKGREEIRSRLGDLADLEDELTESLRDVAREISVDVRDTVRTIREELASAAREFRAQETKGDRPAGGTPPADKAGPAGDDASEEAQRIREKARQSREQMRADFRAQRRGRASASDRASWGDWASWTAWSEWTGSGPGPSGATGAGRASSPDDGDDNGTHSRARRGPAGPFSDLERMAMQFANELRNAAKQTGDIGERSLNDLRDILTDTLAKVRVEVFSDSARDAATDDTPAPGSAEPESGPDNSRADH